MFDTGSFIDDYAVDPILGNDRPDDALHVNVQQAPVAGGGQSGIRRMS